MISVIIPTYNRLEKLKNTLSSLERQRLGSKDFEILVVDDGSDRDTAEGLSHFLKSSRLDIRIFRQEHKGPAAARNLGIEKAQGEIVFFCGDDTRLEPDLLERHKRRHKNNKDIAVLGATLWDEDGQVTDFMRYLAPGGPQFSYHTIKNREDAGFDHFYTSNISLEKKWFAREKFDPRFSEAAFEDIDIGFRLEKKGLKIIYDPLSVVRHSHFYDEPEFYRRMRNVGRAFTVLADKYQDDKKDLWRLKIKYAPFLYFPGLKAFSFLTGVAAACRTVKRLNKNLYWFLNICYYYSLGIRE